MKDRYLLTHLGIVSALGIGVEKTEKSLYCGDTSGMKELYPLSGGDKTVFGFAPLDQSCFESSPTRIAALVDEAMSQLQGAVDEMRKSNPSVRIGAVIGTSNSTMEEFTDNPDKIDMAYPARRLMDKYSLSGPVWAVSTACSSSAKVFESARRLLADDICDAVVVGGADAYTRTVVEGFHSLEALSSTLSRPLDADRDGINLGEGAALFIMRKAEDGEEGVFLSGVGESSDAHHLTAPDPEGRGAEASMRQAIADAGLVPEDIDYVNLHGTGTTYNDSMESQAVLRVFGEKISCSSTKPLTGHCLGAAGAIEAAICWIALKRAHAMPPHCSGTVDINIAPFHIPKVGDKTPLKSALSNSFAFGGSNATLVLTNSAR